MGKITVPWLGLDLFSLFDQMALLQGRHQVSVSLSRMKLMKVMSHIPTLDHIIQKRLAFTVVFKRQNVAK